MENRPNQRRTFLINPRFQITFMAYTIVAAAAVIGIFYCANLFFFWKFTQTGVALGLPPEHVYFQFLTEQRFRMNLVFAVTSSGVFGTLAIAGLVLSHRVAGPVYRLCKHAKDLKEGRVTGGVKFRKKDFFPELADAFNLALGKGTGEELSSSSGKDRGAA